MNINLHPRQQATLVAALRYWQREGLISSGIEVEIAIDNGKFDMLNSTEIDQLIASLSKPLQPPVVVVTLNNGLIKKCFTDAAVQVVLLDEDTEGADGDGVADTDEGECYVHLFAAPELNAQRVNSVVSDLRQQGFF